MTLFLSEEKTTEQGTSSRLSKSIGAAAMAPPSPVSESISQQVQQFLTNSLSQRGPPALPYAEDGKGHIRQHLVALTEAFPSLRPRSASFTHNDGRSAHLLQAEGTMPISFRGAVYHLPVAIWLLESYPRRPPAVYLTPTRDMLVKPGHSLVDPSGLVREDTVPYLSSWVFPASNLVDLVRSLSSPFGIDPPLYTRPSHTPSSPTPSPSPSFSSPYSGGGGPARFPPPPSSQAHSSARPTDDPSEVYRRNAISKILGSVHADMAALHRSREAEMEGLFSTQAELRRRQKVLAHGLREMIEEKEGLEQQLQFVLMNSDLLEGWVRENQELCRRCHDGVDLDDVFEPVDGLSRQMTECTAADMAIEDTIYALDKAVQEGTIAFDSYLRTVRTLSREQFFHRATAAKGRATLVHAQVTSMAARVQQYVSH
ncbi:protein ELC-like [Zingiber officinale]|uniref:protein ELC-like n=1 Tax=Zingiber officinale TaxID=94328 RepID=UPI001C4CE756|nr:protein ELC-like [Zingiber officinale]XP_042430379.1 protein ELC-like [Zingiber officinale]